MNKEKLKSELARAREKASQWQARARDLEKRLQAQENLEILQAVHNVVATPEELHTLLDRLGAAKQEEFHD